MSDRTVHAWAADGRKITRRSGKWALEYPNCHWHEIGINEAVNLAIWFWYHQEGSVNFGIPGGRTFDQRVRQAVAERTV